MNNIIEHKKLLIDLYDNSIIFSGSLFNDKMCLKMQTKECMYPREIFIKYYNIKLNKQITCNNTINILYERLKLKIHTMPFNYIFSHENYISLYTNNYKVEFLTEDMYGEISNPIILTKNEIYKLILYEKQIIIEDQDLHL